MLPDALFGFAGALIAKELYEAYLDDPGAMDHRTLGSAAVLVFLAFVGRMSRSRAPAGPGVGTGGPAASGMGKPVLAVDLDEVCCGYVQAFLRFSNSKHGTKLALHDFTSYSFWEVPKCGLASREEAMERVYAFHASPFFEQIEPIFGTKIALDHLKQHFELHVVTSRQADIERPTRAFVELHFPDTFTAMHFGNHFGKSGAKVSKPDMCRKIGAVALIDDSLEYARQCAAAGLPVFLFGDYPWNRSESALDARITRVASWRIVAQLVTPATCGVES